MYLCFTIKLLKFEAVLSMLHSNTHMRTFSRFNSASFFKLFQLELGQLKQNLWSDKNMVFSSYVPFFCQANSDKALRELKTPVQPGMISSVSLLVCGEGIASQSRSPRNSFAIRKQSASREKGRTRDW